jgi:hypothetical protein
VTDVEHLVDRLVGATWWPLLMSTDRLFMFEIDPDTMTIRIVRYVSDAAPEHRKIVRRGDIPDDVFDALVRYVRRHSVTSGWFDSHGATIFE